MVHIVYTHFTFDVEAYFNNRLCDIVFIFRIKDNNRYLKHVVLNTIINRNADLFNFYV